MRVLEEVVRYSQSRKGFTETSTCPMYVYRRLSVLILLGNPPISVFARREEGPYIDFPVLESLLKILVYCFIGDLTDQSKIRHTNLLLLGCIELGFLDIRLPRRGTLCGRGIVIPLRTTTDTLFQ